MRGIDDKADTHILTAPRECTACDSCIHRFLRSSKRERGKEGAFRPEGGNNFDICPQLFFPNTGAGARKIPYAVQA